MPGFYSNNKFQLRKAEVCCSVARKLTSTAIVAFRVRRSSDNAEQDIGFIGSDVDVSSLVSFVGANTGTVVILYDQSGKGHHLTDQTTTASVGPVIINAGVLNTINGKPAMKSAMIDALTAPMSLFCGPNGEWTTIACARDGLGLSVMINTPTVTGNVGTAATGQTLRVNSNNWETITFNTANTAFSRGIPFTVVNPVIVSSIRTATSIRLMTNNTQSTALTTTGTPKVINTYFVLGYRVDGQGTNDWIGYTSEFISCKIGDLDYAKQMQKWMNSIYMTF